MSERTERWRTTKKSEIDAVEWLMPERTECWRTTKKSIIKESHLMPRYYWLSFIVQKAFMSGC